ncbi:Kelch-like protein 40 [Folsomia candida]|uniref:Kelch-like protein 40 n=1 Tax=Folsomia candida TaxID=158441 RepID=A0A226E7F7_FOLCA|nr:Kelch-like protein 40 [Folsomia candida]
MSPLFESREWTDLTLVLHGENDVVLEEVPVHKLILQAGSSIFNRKITPEVLSTGKLRVDNVDPKIFKLMISYLYTGNAAPSILDAIPLQKLATEYGLPYLTQICKDVLQGEVTEDNALALFEAGMAFADDDLIKSSLQFICKNAQRILKRKDFAELRMECLIEIIQENELQVVNEMEVFDAVYRLPKNYIQTTDKCPISINGLGTCVALLICFLVPPEKRSSIPHGRFSSSPRSWLLPEMERSLANNSDQLRPPVPYYPDVVYPLPPRFSNPTATPPAYVRNSYEPLSTSVPPNAHLQPWSASPQPQPMRPNLTQRLEQHRPMGDFHFSSFHDHRNNYFQ